MVGAKAADFGACSPLGLLILLHPILKRTVRSLKILTMDHEGLWQRKSKPIPLHGG